MNNRWAALAVIFVSFLQLTLNWFVIVPAFGPLVQEMHLGLPQIGLIVGSFIAGYGLAHIPAGLIAEAWGMRFAILLGIALESAGAVLSAMTPDYGLLLLARFICGIGGSIYIGSAIGLTTAWFRQNELVTATGLITGVAFTVGAAIALFGWGPLIIAIGWRPALLCGAGVGAATFLLMLLLFPAPPAGTQAIGGKHLDLASLRRVFGSADLWLMGLSFLGGYGAYFTAAQLLPNYAATHGFSADSASGLGVILLISGIPGSFIGGWLSDRVFGVLPTFLGACILEAVALALVPLLGPAWLGLAAAVIGGAGILAFVGWVSMPGLYRDRIEISDVPTAAGLMLSLVAIGGVAIPALYGKISANYGYSAGWTVIALCCFVSALICLAVRRPAKA